MHSSEEFVTKLCKKLVEQNVISFKEAQALQKAFDESSKEQFDEFLLDQQLVARDDLLRALSEVFQVPSFDVVGYFFDHALVQKFPKGVMLRSAFIPLEVDENMLIVVASNPSDESLLETIGEYVSYDVRFRVGIRRDIEDAIKEFYDESLTVDVPQEDEELEELQERIEAEHRIEEEKDIDEIIDDESRY